MLIYCICTQYLVGAPFALITASIRRGMEVISLWHCWGGMEAQVSLTVAFSSSVFGLLFLIFLLTIPHRFSMGFRSWWVCWQSSTPTPWSFNQLLVLLAVLVRSQILLENEISIFKKLVSRSKNEVLPTFLGKRVAVTLVFKKHNGPTPVDDIAAQIITDCGNLNDDEWCIYIAFYCVLLYPQSALQSRRGGGLSSTTTSVQHPLGWCDSCHRTTAPVHSPHTSYRWREERVIEPIKWMGIIRRLWMMRASGGIWPGHWGYTPTLYEKCHGIFNDHRESRPRFNISSEDGY